MFHDQPLIQKLNLFSPNRHVKNLTVTSSERYQLWFGNYTPEHSWTVQTTFERIVAAGFKNFAYNCTCDDHYAYAYVWKRPTEVYVIPPSFDLLVSKLPSSSGVIWLCKLFWDTPSVGIDSQVCFPSF